MEYQGLKVEERNMSDILEVFLCIYLIIFVGVSIRDTGNRNTFIKIFRILGISTSRFIVKSYFRYAISAAKIMIIATACIILVISI